MCSVHTHTMKIITKGAEELKNVDEKQTKSIQSFKKQTMSEHENNNKIE